MAVLMVVRPPAEPSVDVVVAAADVAPGQALTEADLTVRRYPLGLAPTLALTDPRGVVGRITAVGLPPGTPVTAALLVDAGRGAPGRMLVPFRVADPGVVRLLRVGDLITVTGMDAAGAPVVVVKRVRVAALPQPAGGGALSQEGTDALVVVEVDEPAAVRLSAWSTNPSLSVALG